MDKKLQESSLKFILGRITKDGSIGNIKTYEELFDSVISLSKLKKLGEAKIILNYIRQFQQKEDNFILPKIKDETFFIEGFSDDGIYNPVFYLKSLLFYLKQTNDKKEVKLFLKSIQKALIYIKNHFCNDYLLMFDLFEGKKVFKAKENAILISVCDYTDFLNFHGFIKEADSLFMINERLTLGFERYFWNKKYDLVYDFDELGNFNIISQFEILDLLLEYDFNSDFIKKFMEKENKLFQTSCDLRYRLKYLMLKQKLKLPFEKELKSLSRYLKNFGENLVDKKYFDMDLEISKSLNSIYEEEVVELKKEKKVLRNLNSIEIANLILGF